MIKALLIAFLASATADPIRKLDEKIIGGREISIEEVPYQVTLLFMGNHHCGGSIISEKFVLTASHCIYSIAKGNDDDDYVIRAGSSNRNEGGSLHRVVKIIKHEADLTLLGVSPHFKFDKTRAPIPLFNVKEAIAPKTIALVTGWGLTEANVIPKMLKGVQVPMISKKDCNEAYKSIGGINKGEICAAYPDGGKDACQGDSGGPLAINGRLAGIVSWGIGCAQKEYPGVYVEVAYYAEWIKQNADL